MTERQKKPRRRRTRGEGSVFQRGEDGWVAQITLDDGTQKQFYAKTQKEALEKLKKAQRELEEGTLITEKDQTVRQYLEHWLENIHRLSIKLSSYLRYRELLN